MLKIATIPNHAFVIWNSIEITTMDYSIPQTCRTDKERSCYKCFLNIQLGFVIFPVHSCMEKEENAGVTQVEGIPLLLQIFMISSRLSSGIFAPM